MAAKLSMPDEKIYYVDCETAREVITTHPEFKGRVKFGKFYGFMESVYIIEQIVQEGIYKTFVLDSLSSAQTIEMLSILKNAGFKRAENLGGQQSFTEQDYGLLLNRLTWFLNYVAQVPLNVIILAHIKEPNEKELVNGQKRRIIGSDNQISAVARNIGNLFFMEEVVRDGKRYRAIRTRTDGKVQAKCRIDAMPDYLLADELVENVNNWRLGKSLD